MIYNSNYLLKECEGYKTYLSSKGFNLSPRLKKMFEKVIRLKPERVLDYGCGRGEFSLNLAFKGIDSYGVDISEDAILLSNGIKNYWKKKKASLKLEFIKIDGFNLPFESNFFDVVVLNDVVEHIKEEDLIFIFKDIYRVLKKDGYLLIHTSPGKIFVNFGLKIYWIVAKIYGVKLDFNIRKLLPSGLNKPYHINEQTPFSIKRLLKNSGFKDIKITLDKNPHYIYYFLKDDRFVRVINRIYKFIPVKSLFFSDIYATSKK